MYAAPNMVDLDITLGCNLTCIHCNVDGGEYLEKEMTTTQLKKLITEMYESGVLIIAITGGEPLVRNDWLEVVQHTCSYKGWMTVLNTNGILWDKESIITIAESCPGLKIAVSLDGHSPESYGIIRKNSKGEPATKEFEIMIKNVKEMKRHGLQVEFNFVVTKANLAYFDKVVKLANSLGVEGVLALKFFQYGRGKLYKQELEMSYEEWSDFLENLTEKKCNKSEYKNVEVSVLCPWEFYLPLKAKGFNAERVYEVWGYQSPLTIESYKKKRDVGCGAGVLGCAISPNGEMFPCGTVSAKIPGLECGNVIEKGFRTVWNDSPLLKKMRGLNVGSFGEPCVSCSEKDLCGGGCRSRAYVIKRALQEPDPLCPNVIMHGSPSKEGTA